MLGIFGSWTATTVQSSGGRRIAAAVGPTAGAATFSWYDASGGALKLTDI